MQALFDGIAEILEIDSSVVTPELVLENYAWDSLAIVSTIALVDDLYNVILDGQSLGNCTTVSDIIALIERAKKD